MPSEQSATEVVSNPSSRIQLVSSSDPTERLSDWDLAKRILRDNLRENQRSYELWTNGKWVPADIDDIMKRANMRRKSLGQPQFTGKAEWIVV